jgi:hypothetical protein
MADIDGSERSAFAQAHEAFIASLPTLERSRFEKCSSAVQMLDDLKSWPIITKQRKRGERFLKQIKALSNQLEPYFAAVSIIVQADSEHTGILWGAFRLVLQVCYYHGKCATQR